MESGLDVLSEEIWLSVLDRLPVGGIGLFGVVSQRGFDLARNERVLWAPRALTWFGGPSSTGRLSAILYRSVWNSTGDWDHVRLAHELQFGIEDKIVTKIDEMNDVTWAFLRAPFPDDACVVRWGIVVLEQHDELRVGVTTDPEACMLRRTFSFCEPSAFLYSDGSQTEGFGRFYRQQLECDGNEVHATPFGVGDVVGIELHVATRYLRVFINGARAFPADFGPIPGDGPLWGCVVLDEPGDSVKLLSNWTPACWWRDTARS